MVFVGEIAVGGRDTIRSATTEEFPLGGEAFTYTAARGPTDYVDAKDRGDLASQPCAWNEDNHWVWRFRMRSFTNEATQAKVLGSDLENSELDAALADLYTNGPWTLGFVSHAKDVETSGIDAYEELFSRLSAAGLTMQGLGAVGDAYPWTAGEPVLAISAVTGEGVQALVRTVWCVIGVERASYRKGR